MSPQFSHPGRSILDGTIRNFLAEALIIPTGLFTVVFLTRRLGPEGYGLFSLVATIIAWLGWSVTSVFSRATVKFIGEAQEWQPVGNAVVRLHLVVSSGTALVLWLLAEPIARLLDEPGLSTYIRLFAIDIPFFSLGQAHRNILVGMGSFRQRALATTGRWIARMLFIVLFVELGLSVPGVILGCIGSSLVELALARRYIRPSLFQSSDFPVGRLWAYAAPLFLSTITLRSFDKLDLVMLKALGGTVAQVGIYSAAQNLSVVPGLFAMGFAPILLSTLSRMLRDGDSHAARAMSRNAMRMTLLMMPFAGFTAGAASEIVGLIFGAPFLPAAPLLSILIFGALAGLMISVTTAVLTAAGKPGWTFALTGPLLPLALVGHLLVIPRLGAIGASLVTTILACLCALATVLAVHQMWRVFPPAATLWRSALITALAYALAAYWPVPGFWLLIKLPAIVLVIGTSLLLLGEFSKDEMSLPLSLLGLRIAAQENAEKI